MVSFLIALSAGCPNGWTLLCVQHPKLQTGHIGRLSHLAAKRIYLAGEMSLGQSADGGVAGHLADRIDVDREEQSLASHARRCQGRFDSSVAGTANDHIILLGVNEHNSRAGQNTVRRSKKKVEQPAPFVVGPIVPRGTIL